MAEVNRREIYRYLGIKGQQEPDLQTKALVEDCLEELERSVNCRSFYRRYPLTLLPDSELDFTCFKVKSRALSRNLKDCQEVILFAATLGAGVDLLLRRYSRLSMSRAVVLQACAAARIESYCNEKRRQQKKDSICVPAFRQVMEICRFRASRISAGYWKRKRRWGLH